MKLFRIYAWPMLEPPPGAPDDHTYLYSMALSAEKAHEMVRKLQGQGMACRVTSAGLEDVASENARLAGLPTEAFPGA